MAESCVVSVSQLDSRFVFIIMVRNLFSTSLYFTALAVFLHSQQALTTFIPSNLGG